MIIEELYKVAACKVKKFSFAEDLSGNFLRHNLSPEMLIQIILNDDDEYNVHEDVFEVFEFRDNKIVVKWCADKAVISQFEDYSLIRSILRRAWGWYRSQVYIEKKGYLPGAMEDDRYKLELQPGITDKWLMTDKHNLVTIFFEQGSFKESQRIVNFDNIKTNQLETLPRIIQELADWLVKNHRDKI